MNAQKNKVLKSTLRYIIGKFEDIKEKENIKTSQRKKHRLPTNDVASNLW